jgi:hypothetical protein
MSSHCSSVKSVGYDFLTAFIAPFSYFCYFTGSIWLWKLFCRSFQTLSYGYCEIGKRFEAVRSGRRTERVSWIAALKEKEIFAPMTFTGGVRVTF